MEEELLEEKKPKNVVTILFDGMGSYILDKHLTKDSFFIKNKYYKGNYRKYS